MMIAIKYIHKKLTDHEHVTTFISMFMGLLLVNIAKHYYDSDILLFIGLILIARFIIDAVIEFGSGIYGIFKWIKNDYENYKKGMK